MPGDVFTHGPYHPIGHEASQRWHMRTVSDCFYAIGYRWTAIQRAIVLADDRSLSVGLQQRRHSLITLLLQALILF